VSNVACYNVFPESDGVDNTKNLIVRKARSVKHQLLGQGFYWQWRDCCGIVKEIYGTIIQCFKQSDGKFFTISWDEFFHDYKLGALGSDLIHTKWEGIEEAEAWGGYLAYLSVSKKKSNFPIPSPYPFYKKFIVPGTRKEIQLTSNDLPIVSMIVEDFVLILEAKESSIPGAGLGLWLTCKSLGG